MQNEKVLNSKGEEILLTDREARIAGMCQRHVNDLGFEVNITTLTTIMKRITEQKFFEVAPADYLPVRVGEGAWSSNLTTYRSFDLGDDFETGVVNTGANNARLATADAGVDAMNISVQNWAKELGWTLMDLELAAKAGNWDIVTAKETARKKNWDLGIQRISFLGARGLNQNGGSCLGLLNQPAATKVTGLITKPLSTMTPAELKTFQAKIIGEFRKNCEYTAWPSHFVIPELDYTGLASQAAPDFPIKSTLQLLEEAFQTITRNKQFKILPLAYAESAVGGLGVQRYALYRYDEESIRMDIPVDYTTTLANSVNNFSFQNVGYGQFTGVGLYRPLELMYFDYTP